MAPEPARIPDPCTEKARMFQELTAAMAAMAILNSREMQAVTDGDLAKIEAIWVELRNAKDRKDTLMFAYKSHVAGHGC